MLVGCFLRKHFVQEGDALPVSVVQPLPERMFEEGERIGACQADDGCHKLSREPVDELLDAIDLRPVRMDRLPPIIMARKVNIKPMPVMKAGSYP